MYFFFPFEASLHAGIDLKECVKLPKDQDFMDWVAVHGMLSKLVQVKLNNSPHLHIKIACGYTEYIVSRMFASDNTHPILYT